jgi:hypothetical protein
LRRGALRLAGFLLGAAFLGAALRLAGLRLAAFLGAALRLAGLLLFAGGIVNTSSHLRVVVTKVTCAFFLRKNMQQFCCVMRMVIKVFCMTSMYTKNFFTTYIHYKSFLLTKE